MTKENTEVQKISEDENENSESEKITLGFKQLRNIAEYWKDSVSEKARNTTSEAERKNYLKLADKYYGIQDILLSFLVKGQELSLEETLDSLNKQIENIQTSKRSTKDDKIYERLDRMEEALGNTTNFLKEQVSNIEASPAFFEWLDEKYKREKKLTQERADREVVQSQRSQQEIRQKLEEREKEKQLIQEVAEKGGAAIYMSLPSEYSPVKSNGFTFKPDVRKLTKFNKNEESLNISMAFRNAYLGGEYKNKKFDDVCGEQKIFEAVAILPITEDVYQEVDVPVQEKKFGIFKKETTRKERKKVGVKQVLHNELVEKGQAESAYRIIYRANDRVDKQGHSFYQDYSGRFGNMLDIDIILPKSLADKVMEQIKANPKIIRDITKALIVKNLDIPEDAWEKGDKYTHHSLKPPYEEWAKNLGGKNKIYIQENADIEGFNPDWVKEI